MQVHLAAFLFLLAGGCTVRCQNEEEDGYGAPIAPVIGPQQLRELVRGGGGGGGGGADLDFGPDVGLLDLPPVAGGLADGRPAAPPITSSTFEALSLPPIQPRQRQAKALDVQEEGGGVIDFSQAARTADGRLCVVKEESVETLAKDPILQCTHKREEKCYYSYVTYFKPSQEEVCEENFEKSCQITFRKQAVRETVKKCYKPQRKVCNGQGEEACQIVYESSCQTRYSEKRPGKFVGETNCEKLPVEICGRGCTVEEGEEECHDKEVDTLLEVPEETCDLNPQKTCRLVTRLVPNLEPKHVCAEVPREVCSLKFSQPRREKKPLRTEWCLDEANEVPGARPRVFKL